MINIVVVGLTQTKLANLANTKVKREVLVVFINFSPLPVNTQGSLFITIWISRKENHSIDHALVSLTEAVRIHIV